MNKLDLAWAAGFYEGEGSCGVYGFTHAPASKRLVMSATQNDVTPLLWFKSAFGGGICKDKWQLSGDIVADILHLFLPYIKSVYKREQIFKALDSWELYLATKNQKRITEIARKKGPGFVLRFDKKWIGTYDSLDEAKRIEEYFRCNKCGTPVRDVKCIPETQVVLTQSVS